MNSESGIRHSPFASFAFVALGSNLGDSRTLLREVTDRIQAFSDQPLLKSSLWQTTPVRCPAGSPLFVNAVVGLVPRAEDTPEFMLAGLQALEREFGRPPKIVHNEPRLLDLDLIAFGAETRSAPQLVLPHPRAHLRRFVLLPLSEIAPALVLPGQLNTVAELLAGLQDSEGAVRLGDG